MELKLPGMASGYVNFDKVMAEVNAKGGVKLPFSRFYDARQRGVDALKGAYIVITKTA